MTTYGFCHIELKKIWKNEMRKTFLLKLRTHHWALIKMWVEKQIPIIFLFLVHYSFLNPGEAIMAKYCQKLQRMCLALANRKGKILLYDNTRPHIAQLTLQKLNELRYERLSHQPYSPKLSTTDYHFFKLSI